MSGKPAPKRKLKIRKPEKPIGLFMEEVSARNSETRQDELYLVLDGQRIAKRGHPGTPEAMTWVPLVEGLSFVDDHPDDGVPVFDAGEIQMMPEPRGAKQ
jgi:hypothetical protein